VGGMAIEHGLVSRVDLPRMVSNDHLGGEAHTLGRWVTGVL
jgi:hypothetical protein